MGSPGASSNVPTATGSRVNARNCPGLMNSVAFLVMTTFTRRPAFCKPRTTSHALYAATHPVTPSRTVFFIFAPPQIVIVTCIIAMALRIIVLTACREPYIFLSARVSSTACKSSGKSSSKCISSPVMGWSSVSMKECKNCLFKPKFAESALGML